MKHAREPYDWTDLGLIGYVGQLTELKGKPAPKHPVGFAPGKKARIGGRVAGTWPKVGRL